MRHLATAAGLVWLIGLPASAQEAALVRNGRDLYAAKECDRCHMVAGKGYKDGKLDGIASKMRADQMRKWLMSPREMEAGLDEKPKVRMSSRKGMTLNDAEVTALVAYLRTLR
jgi:mono/diheme cytochrome c family protein